MVSIMEITRLLTEYQECPMGLEEETPVFSWEFSTKDKKEMQQAYQLQVWKQKDKTEVWNSGKTESTASYPIEYKGSPLEPCTEYGVRLTVWDKTGKRTEKESSFETGLRNPDIEAWEGAGWIAAPRYAVMARTRGVFCIETAFRMAEGANRAGIVFGEGDYRLEDAALNEYGLAGENYIRYEVNCQKENYPVLQIYRVGYAPNDSSEIPFASVELINAETGKVLLTSKNREEFHTLSVLVSGNQARASLDGILIDAPMGGNALSGRVLNPRGSNDVLTYPRLNRIGFFAGGTGKVYFKNLTVSNVRAPGAVVIDETPSGGLYGAASIFEGKLAKETVGFANGDEETAECFVLSGGGTKGENQVTADPSHTSIPMFRTTWEVKKSVERARLYLTSRGIYEAAINGTAVTNRLLAPGITQYDKRLQYQTYDVTGLLKEGKNGLGVVLSSGWWSDAQTFTVANYNYFGDREALLCKLVVEYADGTREVVVSNPETWQYYGEGPWQYAGLFLGEQYDARRSAIGKEFSLAEFETDGWEKPVTYRSEKIAAYNPGFGRSYPTVNETEPLIVGGYDAPVSVVEVRAAVKRVPTEGQSCLYDFGQEMAGVPELVFREPEGTKILIRYGEMLYPELPRYGKNAGHLMRENYRDAESTDVYICRGDADGEVYRPRFTFHGFRYLELHGVTNFPELCEVKALQYSSVTEFQGSFQCSEPLLNRFAENVRWSQLCNFINIPTDCPQRNERMGWAGDTHVFCRTALYNSNLKLFYERNLQAMADLQEEDGRYPEIAPIGGGFGGITYECATIFMAWELYQQYGDIRTLQRFYPGMKKYMDYMKHAGMPGIGREELVGPLSDWLAFQETDAWLMWNAFYYKEAVLMAKIAKLLEKDEDWWEYSELKKQIHCFWNRRFVEENTGRTLSADGTLCDTQCSYALALEFELTEQPEKIGQHLVRKVKENGYKVGTGFFGTGLLNPALSRTGHGDEAYQLLLQTEYPSWLYPVTQGATTIWEHWDSYTKERGFGEYNSMNSFNHYSLGSVLSWMYEEILGIQRQEEYPGFTHFLLKPDIRKLEYAQGSVASLAGKIESGWYRGEGKLKYHCTIPANTTATLVLPGQEAQELGSGRYEFEV